MAFPSSCNWATFCPWCKPVQSSQNWRGAIQKVFLCLILVSCNTFCRGRKDRAIFQSCFTKFFEFLYSVLLSLHICKLCLVGLFTCHLEELSERLVLMKGPIKYVTNDIVIEKYKHSKFYVNGKSNGGAMRLFSRLHQGLYAGTIKWSSEQTFLSRYPLIFNGLRLEYRSLLSLEVL